MNSLHILVVNPGSTSTKLAYFEGDAKVFESAPGHPEEELARSGDIPSQLDFRMAAVNDFIMENGLERRGLDAVAARGGLMKPVKSGAYRINRQMVEDLKNSRARWGREHASNLGAMMALRLAEKHNVPAFTADPVTVDEMDDVARISGVPEITRKSLLHALNVKAVFRLAVRELGLDSRRADFVIAHIGGGVSVAAVRGGRIVDVNNALLGMGPFSPMRAGALPIGDLAGLALSGRYDRKGLESKLVRDSGLMGYLGTADVVEAEARIGAGDKKAELIYNAMAYQVSKEIAAMASALSGRVDGIVLTGGVANSAKFTGIIKARVGFIGRVLVYPGEQEMEALAWHARAALSGEEEVLEYR